MIDDGYDSRHEARDTFLDICEDAQKLHDELMQLQKFGGPATLDQLIDTLQISGRLAGLLTAPAPLEPETPADPLDNRFARIAPQYCETHDVVHKCELMLATPAPADTGAAVSSRGLAPRREFKGFITSVERPTIELPTDTGDTPQPQDALRKAIIELLNVMETCHVCSGQLLLQDWPVHCEDCSADCENHEGEECTSIHVLHARVKKLLAATGKTPDALPIDWGDVPPLSNLERTELNELRKECGYGYDKAFAPDLAGEKPKRDQELRCPKCQSDTFDVIGGMAVCQGWVFKGPVKAENATMCRYRAPIREFWATLPAREAKEK